MVLVLLACIPSYSDIYDSDGSLGDLVVSSGTLTIDTDVPSISGAVNVTGVVESGVAVFRFAKVNVGAGVTIVTQGARPCSITASGDMYWGASIDASASTDNARLGGAKGGKGGNGG
ncbi:MAG TPA: hypothetical protein PLI07_12075, partial [Candidatus Hydrogenedentes bacterium]|nr:hypothetical protein [Candidatus Hydrogenedentota bacterium]